MTQLFRILLVLVLVAFAACSKNLSVTVEVPKEQIQKKVEEKFPVKPGGEDKASAMLDLTVSDPEVILEEGKNQIGVKVNLVAVPSQTPRKPPVPAAQPGLPGPPPGPPGMVRNPPPLAGGSRPALPSLPNLRLTGTATFFAGISYDPATQTIHLSDPKITELQIAQLPANLTDMVRQMAEKAVAKKLTEQAIKLESKTDLEKSVKPFMKSVTVKNGKVLVELGL